MALIKRQLMGLKDESTTDVLQNAVHDVAKSESILIDFYIKMSVLVSISSALIKTGHRHA